MRYILLIHADTGGWGGLASWSRDDFKRMVGYMRDLDARLRESGELLHDNGLAGPGSARTVRAQPGGEAVVRDGLREGASDVLAGYWVVDVAGPERAVEIATEISLTPGPGGRPLDQQVEIHAIGEAPEV
jgi:hypothetical protein